MKKSWTNVVLPVTGVAGASIVGILWVQNHAMAPAPAPLPETAIAANIVSAPSSAAGPITINEVTRFQPFQVGAAAEMGSAEPIQTVSSSHTVIANTTFEGSGAVVGDVAITRAYLLSLASMKTMETSSAPVVLLASATADRTSPSANSNQQETAAKVDSSQEVINAGQAIINVGSAIINVSSSFILNYGGKTILTGSNGTVTPSF